MNNTSISRRSFFGFILVASIATLLPAPSAQAAPKQTALERFEQSFRRYFRWTAAHAYNSWAESWQMACRVGMFLGAFQADNYPENFAEVEGEWRRRIHNQEKDLSAKEQAHAMTRVYKECIAQLEQDFGKYPKEARAILQLFYYGDHTKPQPETAEERYRTLRAEIYNRLQFVGGKTAERDYTQELGFVEQAFLYRKGIRLPV